MKKINWDSLKTPKSRYQETQGERLKILKGPDNLERQKVLEDLGKTLYKAGIEDKNGNLTSRYSCNDRELSQ